VERAISRDRMLADISLYWFTGAIGSSFWPYYARLHGSAILPPGDTISVPTGYAEFPREIVKPRARRRHASSPTSAVGASCPGVDTSQPSSSRIYSPAKCAPSSGNCGNSATILSTLISQPAQIVRHVAEFPQELRVAEFADHGIAAAAEGDRADAAGDPRQDFRAARCRRRTLAFLRGAGDRRAALVLQERIAT